MSKLKTYSEFINETLIDAVKNPIKWKKIKNNAKAYQKAKVAQALNDVDYAKRLEKGSDTLSAKQKDVLTQANKTKNSALSDTTTNIGQRMDDLATTDGLKQVAKLAKTKSALAANAIVLKAADGEEAKRLKIKQKELTGKATDAQKALADYESDSGEEKKDSTMPKEPEAPNTEAPNTEAPNADDAPEKPDNTEKIAALDTKIDGLKKDKKTKEDQLNSKNHPDVLAAETAIKSAELEKAKLEDNPESVASAENALKTAKDDQKAAVDKDAADKAEDDPTAKIEADIKAFNDNIEAERTTMNKATTDLEQAQRDLKTGRGSEEKVQKLQKAIEDSKEDIAELKKQETEAKKKLAALVPESFEYVAESISQKFARLRSNL